MNPTEQLEEFTIVGRDDSGNIVASEQTDSRRHSERVADSWRASGLKVEIIEAAKDGFVGRCRLP
jgi:hypothetical protein